MCALVTCSRQPGSRPWHPRPHPHPPGTADHRIEPAAPRGRPERFAPRPSRGQTRQRLGQMAALLRLTRPLDVQLASTQHRLPVLLNLTPEVLLRDSRLPVEEGREVRGVCGQFSVLVRHRRDGAGSRGAAGLLLCLGVPCLYSRLPVHPPRGHRSSQPLVVFCRSCPAGLSFLYPSGRPDCRVWLRDTRVLPAEECAGELDICLLYVLGQAEDIQKAEHVLSRSGTLCCSCTDLLWLLMFEELVYSCVGSSTDDTWCWYCWGGTTCFGYQCLQMNWKDKHPNLNVKHDFIFWNTDLCMLECSHLSVPYLNPYVFINT